MVDVPSMSPNDAGGISADGALLVFGFIGVPVVSEDAVVLTTLV